MRPKLLFIVLLGALMFTVGCRGCGKAHRGKVKIAIAEVAVSVWDDGVTVGAQVQLENVGTAVARGLELTRIELRGGTYQGPVTLPTPSLGDLDPGEDLRFDAVLKVPAADGSPRMLVVEGTYRDGTVQHFRVERILKPRVAAPGPISATPGSIPKQNPAIATYPPRAVTPRGRPNAETPVFVPIGPPRQLFPPTPTGTGLQTTPGGAAVQIPRNTSTGSRNAGTPPDPNGAAATASGVVLMTYNTGISVSTNGGVTFTDVNLLGPDPANPARTTFFPENDGGLCCDQVMVYLPGQNLFVWLLQYNPITACATNCPPQPPGTPPPTFRITQASRIRIAWATPAAVAADFWNAWSYCDLTGPGLGTTNAEWLDYPDLAWSNTFIYVGVDHGATTPGKVYTGRRMVARLSLADMVNTAATRIGYGFAELTGSNGLNKTHFVQNAPGRMVVGSLDNSSTMRVFTWNDTDGFITPTTVGVSQIQQGASYTSIAPDRSDWLAVSFPGNITGGVYRSVIRFGAPSQDEYLFAFDAGANAAGGRPQAYLRLETLTPSSGSNYTVTSEYDVWNGSYAYAMGALGTDGREIGITLAVGGGTLGFPQMAVGYKDDFVVYQVTNSNATQIVRFGDYLSNRAITGGLFASAVYDVVLNPLPPGVTSGTCATVGCRANMRFVEYGRPPVPPPR